jgi:lipopolysaccharide/colanic/teichoic acid biosynthesis glycosyltransferase
MALVGPRPIVLDEVSQYGVHFRHYCAVRPGLTGLWQVSGRNNVSFRRRIVMDVAYVRARCLMLDVSILAKTLPAVLQQRGSY